MTPDASLRYWRGELGEIDPPLLRVAAETVKPGDVVWDVGANLGLFAFAAAGLSGSEGFVYAIEPDTHLVGLLRSSTSIPTVDAARVEVVPLAVADAVGLQRFQIAARGRAANCLQGHGSSQAGGVREVQTVMCVTLDWLAGQLRPPNVVKIDTEGAEVRVLKGATALIGSCRPTILCEVRSENQREVSVLLRDYGYCLFDGDRSAKERVPLETAPWSTLAVPGDRAVAVK